MNIYIYIYKRNNFSIELFERDDMKFEMNNNFYRSFKKKKKLKQKKERKKKKTKTKEENSFKQNISATSSLRLMQSWKQSERDTIVEIVRIFIRDRTKSTDRDAGPRSSILVCEFQSNIVSFDRQIIRIFAAFSNEFFPNFSFIEVG